MSRWNSFKSRTNDAHDRKESVLIVGAGAAGMACAEMLSREPDRYQVMILERDNTVGGQATSISIDGSEHGVDWVNNGVQLAAPNSALTFHFLRQYGYEVQEIKHQIAFGKGPENFWTNAYPTPLIRKHQKEIERFGKVMRRTTLPSYLLWMIPLKNYLYLLGFSKEFMNKIIYPLASTLIGVGNNGDKIPVALAQWLFDEQRRRIWEYNDNSFGAGLQSIYIFPNMGRFYEDWAQGLRSKGVKIRLNTRAIKVIERGKSGVVVETRSVEADPRIDSEGNGERSITESFDHLVLCIHADDAKRILGKQATRLEKKALGGVKYYDDLTVTHTDASYFLAKYEAIFREDLCAEPISQEEEERIKYAKGEMGIHSGFRPAYCTYSYNSRPDKVEVAYDCSSLQYQFQKDPESRESPIPLEKHIFQSHFMSEELKDLWTVDQIHASGIIEQKWWRQPMQSWKHWATVVPRLKRINGKNNTIYAGGWTIVNVPEAATASGVAAACRIGARYEGFDDAANENICRYFRLCHGKRLSRTVGRDGKGRTKS